MDPDTLVYHELRTPLALIATAARAAAEDCADDALRDRCETINRVAERMLSTARQVVATAARGDSPRLSPGRYRPQAVVEQLAGDLRTLGVAVELSSSPAAACWQAPGNRDQFEALLQSLLDNAIEHGDRAAPVLIELATRGGTLTVDIRNRLAPVKTHAGAGMGSHVAALLAECLAGTIETRHDGREYRVTLTFATPEAGAPVRRRGSRRSSAGRRQR